MSLLEVAGLTHYFGDKIIYNKAGFTLHKQDHMGIVGLNGAGKSTLIKILAGEILPDDGTIIWAPKIKTGYLDQYAQTDMDMTVLQLMQSCYQQLYELEHRLGLLYAKLASGASGHDAVFAEISDCQERLERENFYGIDSEIKKVGTGLGLEALGFETPLKNLSGGQRAKVILAKLLLQKPDLLIMDEPTNFLDREHIDWLSQYLNAFEGAFIIASHDEDFLNRISNCICHVEFHRIKKYSGTYTHFLSQLEFQRQNHTRQYYAQKKEIERVEAFIRRNKAGVNSKMARGREKQLARVERLAPPDYSSLKPAFHFKEAVCHTQVVLQASQLQIGYSYPLLPKLDLEIKKGEKIGVTGFNGIGKSTLLNTLLGKLAPITGSCSLGDKVIPAYYGQDLLWQDSRLTPEQAILGQQPMLKKNQVMKLLAENGIKAEHARQAIASLSGGEQAKLKLCMLSMNPCSLLVMDEPTNHLDIDAKKALQEALIKYQGTLVIVSHDPEFYLPFTTGILDIEKIAGYILQ